MYSQDNNSYEALIKPNQIGEPYIQATNFTACDSNIVIFDGNRPPMCINICEYGKKIITFGRSSDNDIVLTSSLISMRHGHFELCGDTIILRDTGSKAGTTKNGIYLKESILAPGDVIKVDNYNQYSTETVIMLISSKDSSVWNKKDLHNCTSITIGRASNNDIVIEHIGVSLKHAVLREQGNTWFIQDTNSTNGTFLNGNRVFGNTKLSEKDVILISNTKIIYAAGFLYYYTNLAGLAISVSHIVKTLRIKDLLIDFAKNVTLGSNNGRFINILNDVSLEIGPSELVAITGPSGSAKITLMNVISGYVRPSSGHIIINGENLYYRNIRENFSSLIGYVPKDIIVYDDLTIYTSLNYAAKLRLPDDISQDECDRRIRIVLDMVELSNCRDTMIRHLSEWQKTKVCIAAELLTDPQLLVVEEHLSVSNAGVKHDFIRILKNITANGTTVILITNSIQNLQICDRILFMGRGGKLCYNGNSESAKRFFGIDNLDNIYDMIAENPDSWRMEYDALMNAQNRELRVNIGRTSAIKAKRYNKHSGIKQIGVLNERNFKLMMQDKNKLYLLFTDALLLITFLLLLTSGTQHRYYGITKSLLFTFSCSAFLIGMLDSIPEICKESHIFVREYLTGLKTIPYIISKLMVIGFIAIIQSLILTFGFVLLIGSPDKGVFILPFIELFLTTFLTLLSASAKGLFISSLYRRQDIAMAATPIALMFEILFSGLLFELKGGAKLISLFTICRWAMEAFGTITDLNSLQYIVKISGRMTEIPREVENCFLHTPEHLTMVWLIMLALFFIFAALSILALNILRDKRF